MPARFLIVRNMLLVTAVVSLKRIVVSKNKWGWPHEFLQEMEEPKLVPKSRLGGLQSASGSLLAPQNNKKWDKILCWGIGSW